MWIGCSRSACSQVSPFSKYLEKGSFGWFPPPGLPWICPFSKWLLSPHLGTSSHAHLFVLSLNVAKYNLGKVRLKPMLPAVSPAR